MKHRMFRVVATGQWAAAVVSDETFNDDGTEYADRLATDLGLATGALEVVEVVDGEPDPRLGDLLLPAPPPAESGEPEPAAPAMRTNLRLPEKGA